MALPNPGTTEGDVSLAGGRFLKRYRMECPVQSAKNGPADLPKGYSWEKWTPEISHLHGLVLHQSFKGEKDSQLFLSFTTLAGCENLLKEMGQRTDFLPEATWLILGPDGPCATLQSLFQKGNVVSVQNIAVVPEHRGKGLGKALVKKLFQMMHEHQFPMAWLEVTADNERAIRLYESMGFIRTKVLYKELPIPAIIGEAGK